jgi:hypothetical protein
MYVQSMYMKCITNLILDLARQYGDVSSAPRFQASRMTSGGEIAAEHLGQASGCDTRANLYNLMK